MILGLLVPIVKYCNIWIVDLVVVLQEKNIQVENIIFVTNQLKSYASRTN